MAYDSPSVAESYPSSLCDSLNTPLTPNTRKRKCRFSEVLTDTMKEFNLPKDDLIDVLNLSLKNMDIDTIKSNRKQTKAGRKKISMETRNAVWNFWHENATKSTLVHRPAKLRVSDRNKIQCDLDFILSVTVMKQESKEFYISC